jgi:hypothetical protein
MSAYSTAPQIIGSGAPNDAIISTYTIHCLLVWRYCVNSADGVALIVSKNLLVLPVLPALTDNKFTVAPTLSISIYLFADFLVSTKKDK